MSLVTASKHVALASYTLGRSYIGISHFWKQQYYGQTYHGQISHLVKNSRCLSIPIHNSETSSVLELDVPIYNKTGTKSLENYKKSLQQKFGDEVVFRKIEDAPLNSEIELLGYLSTRRNVNKDLSFAMLRNGNSSWCIQLVSSQNEEGTTKEVHERLKSMRDWTPVIARGKVTERKPPENMKFNGMKLVQTREVVLHEIQPLNEISDHIIIKEEAVFGSAQRHLQFRTTNKLRQRIHLRAKITHRARTVLYEGGWKEIETPILFKSTPEGAREFLVPTRQKGLAYALPQSPQQYKQILMGSGFLKYFQFARCFRDEDLRMDRQPEFTQLDIEAAFADEREIMKVVEMVLNTVFYKVLDLKIAGQFTYMTYQDAMSLYGSDKPDLRFTNTIQSINKYLSADTISKMTSLEDPIIDACKISSTAHPEETRKNISNFLNSEAGAAFRVNPDGSPGIFVCDAAQPMHGLGPLGYDYVMAAPEELALQPGELLLVQARPNKPFTGGSTALGRLRIAVQKEVLRRETPPKPHETDFKFVWITDFPLFSPVDPNDTDPGQGGRSGLKATHHPFTAPKTPEDVDLLFTDPLSATAAHYDIVLNGVEIGGGSRRIHNAVVQEMIFRDILQMPEARIEDFRHLLDVLGSGCPPHAGIALGWDRIVAMMCGVSSIRNVIAFPKSGKGHDTLVGSPHRMTQQQLDMYHLEVKGTSMIAEAKEDEKELRAIDDAVFGMLGRAEDQEPREENIERNEEVIDDTLHNIPGGTRAPKHSEHSELAKPVDNIIEEEGEVQGLKKEEGIVSDFQSDILGTQDTEREKWNGEGQKRE